MIIEKLKYKDIEKYKELIDDSFGSSNNIEVYRKMYKEDSNYNIIVCKDNDKIVGSITYITIDLFTFNNQPFVELFNVCTNIDYRRMGIAEKILKYIKKEVKKLGYKSIYLTCLENACGAHRFYENMGFRKTDSPKFVLDLD